ncbi:MAG: hypothetical protein HGA22_05920, partial [Clostridiales bacterium]|nr:hypothetical protein [Clostridiales bacterium]
MSNESDKFIRMLTHIEEVFDGYRDNEDSGPISELLNNPDYDEYIKKRFPNCRKEELADILKNPAERDSRLYPADRIIFCCHPRFKKR